jgi:hypothetical protein
MIAFFAVFVHHVPKYGGCPYGCCHLPHGPTTSQVAYLRGSGGVEYDLHELHGEEVLDFNVVFRKAYDPSTFSVYVGCGGCASLKPFHWDEPLTLPLDLPKTYQDARFEPFTQHSYYELLPKGAARQFDLKRLANCTSHHASVRLIVHDNVTEDIVWGAVVGCEGLACEKFTTLERLSFPIYVVRNHGRTWNDAAWTLPFFMVFVAALMVLSLWWWGEGTLVFYRPVGPSFPRQLARMRPGVAWSELKAICWVQDPRTLFYAVATWAVVVDIFETTAHAMIAARDVPAGDDGYTWFIGVYGVRWLLLVAVAVPWAAMREVPEAQWRSYKMKRPFGDWYDGLMPSSPFWAQGYWSLLDLAVALLTLFLLGVGFFFLPVAAIAAGLLRFANWVRKPPEEPQPCKSTIYVNLEDADTACGYPTPSNVTPGLYLS